MAITPNDFEKIWSSNASTPAYTFTEADYLEGWDFVGNLPPTRAQWNAIQKRTDEKMKYVFDNFGAPLLANTVADMTLENRVYVYTGSEVGYVAGDWYYYDTGTSAWVDGGVYNASAVQTDTTLTQAGISADAKSTGDYIRSIIGYKINASLFAVGTLRTSNGTNSPSSTRMRTTNTLTKDVVGFRVATGYDHMIFAYQEDGTYVGVWDGTTFVQASSWQTNTDVDVLFYGINAGYKYKLVIRRTDEGNIDLTVDADKVTFIYATDKTLSISGMSADAEAVQNILKSVVWGGYTFINTTTKNSICNGTMDDIPVNTIYTISGDADLVNNPGFSGVHTVITFSSSNTRSTRSGMWQLVVGANEGSVMYYRGYNSGAWSSWQRVATNSTLLNYLRCKIGTFDPLNYSNNLVNITGAYCGFIVPSDWEDAPIKSTVETTFMVFPTTTAFSLQMLFGNRYYGNSVTNNVYYRLVRTNGTVYKDWQPIGGYDARNVLAIGDSICLGDRNGNRGFVGLIGIPYVNAGVSGATIASGTGHGWIEQQLINRTENTNYFDAIIMEGGINDYIHDVPLGTQSSVPVRTTDTAKYEALDTTTVIGALEHLFVTLQSKYPNIDKFFLITHKTRNYPFTKNYTNGYTQDELHDAIVSACKLYNVQVIDVYAESPINTYFPEYVSPTDWADDHSITDLYWVNNDRVHPLNYGYLHGYVPLIVKAFKGTSHKA